MDAARRQQIDTLCAAALDREPRERAAFVAAVCGDDVALRHEVEALLAHARTAEGLTAPVVAVAAYGMGEARATTLAAGTRIGPYEVLAPIGVGGMGEVYRARDTQLMREVAIKILPDSFATDPERLARFRREAKVLASLNHPHIAAVYGLERFGDGQALVMELVGGEDLSQRIARGVIPIDEVLAIAKQIAEALEAAHEQGVIHRDLKPANIKIREDGTVKVLDFGLAKALEPVAGRPGAATMSPTITSPATMTGVGVLLGTAAYMSPEQAKGKPADKRSDIWAFGAVLYEMLTGRRPFEGEDASDTIAAVLRSEPDWNALPNDTPSTIRTLVVRCLQKDVKKRVRDAGDIVIECEQAITISVTSAATPPIVARAFLRRSLVIGLAGLLLGGFITGLAVWRLKPAPAPPVRRLTMLLPSGQRLEGLNLTAIALSPDEKRLAYVASAGGPQQLYVREMDSVEGKPIAGTEGAVSPFFSPDGQWLGFFTVDRLKKVSVSGSQLVILAPVSDYGKGGTWGSDGNIVFASANDSGLSVVPAVGGTAQTLTRLDSRKGEGSHRFPHYLPGGDALLFTTGTGGSWDEARIELLKLSSGERKMLIEGGSDAIYVPTGHLLYLRAGALMSVPVDIDRLEVKGSPVALFHGVLPSTENTGAAQATFASSGSLVYVSGGGRAGERSVVWVDRKGTEQPSQLSPRAYSHPRLSPNDQRVALVIDEGNNANVWVYDFPRGTLTRLTFEGAFGPIWTSDGKKVTFNSNPASLNAPLNLFWKPADSSATEERLTTSENPQAPASWSPNGETLAFNEFDPITGADLWLLSLKEGKKSRPLVRGSFNEFNLSFSPDGRWFAYQSNESGSYEVYVQPFPGPGSKELVSTQGGTEPVWSRDGRELFYRSGDKMMAVGTTTQPTFRAARPEVLFERRYYNQTQSRRDYDVTSDGRRFLMLKESEQATTTTRIEVVLSWFEELKRLVPR
jgi:eukaryotic-like serine/threonine-protein kinase